MPVGTSITRSWGSRSSVRTSAIGSSSAAGAGPELAVTASTIGTADTQTQIAWRVPDIHAAVADLRALGVRIEEYQAPDPVTVDGIADMGHSWAAWFIDPSRNVLAVVQPKG